MREGGITDLLELGYHGTGVGEPLDVMVGSPGEPAVEVGVVVKALDGCGNGSRVFGAAVQAVCSMGDNLGEPAPVCGNDRHPLGTCLDGHETETLVYDGGHHGEVGVAEKLFGIGIPYDADARVVSSLLQNVLMKHFRDRFAADGEAEVALQHLEGADEIDDSLAFGEGGYKAYLHGALALPEVCFVFYGDGLGVVDHAARLAGEACLLKPL